MKLLIAVGVAVFIVGCAVCDNIRTPVLTPGAETIRSAALVDMKECRFLGIVHAAWGDDDCRSESEIINILVDLVRSKAYRRSATHLVFEDVGRLSVIHNYFELNAQVFYCPNTSAESADAWLSGPEATDVPQSESESPSTRTVASQGDTDPGVDSED